MRVLPNKPWAPGESGNPAGRPRGTRHKLSTRFLKDVAGEWERRGAVALAELDGVDLCRLVASLVPRELRVDGELPTIVLTYVSVPPLADAETCGAVIDGDSVEHGEDAAADVNGDRDDEAVIEADGAEEDSKGDNVTFVPGGSVAAYDRTKGAEPGIMSCDGTKFADLPTLDIDGAELTAVAVTSPGESASTPEAERRMGQILKATKDKRAKPLSGKGQKKTDRRSRLVTDGDEPPIAALGITKNESAKAQKLADLPEETGITNPSNVGMGFENGKTLADFGITYNQSSDWQKLAAVPETEFEAAIPADDAHRELLAQSRRAREFEQPDNAHWFE